MNAYEILLKVHRIGSRISGVVTARHSGYLEVQTEAGFPAILPYSYLVDEEPSDTPTIIPEIGASVDTVVFNFVDGKLFLSAKPKDLSSASICAWQKYYDFIESLTVGSTITGAVVRVEPFGLFVDIGGPFHGLIDIGHSEFNGGVRLPRDTAEWPKVGNIITCNIGYFRLHNQQVGLGWTPACEAV